MVKIWLNWTNYHSSVLMWLITVQHNQSRAWEAKMCHFRRQKHDIMMPKATLGSNSIYWNVFKLWLATKHKNDQSLFSPKAHISWSLLYECHLKSAEHLAHKAKYQKVKAARSCFKSLFSFYLFVFCFFPGVRHSWALTKLSVTWLKSSGFMSTCYTSHLWLKAELTAALRLNPDAVIQDSS